MKTLEKRVEEKLKELSDFKNAEVGDNIFYLPENKFVKIHEIDNVNTLNTYPIKTDVGTMTFKGKYSICDKMSSVYTKNPFIEIAKMFQNENNLFEERWMMVCDNLRDWKKRKVIMFKNGVFLAWDGSETDEDVEKSTKTVTWLYAKEIEEPKDIELTLEEIAEKFGVDVKNLKIKK